MCVYHTACVSYGLEDTKNICIDWFMKNLLVTQDICYIRDIRLVHIYIFTFSKQALNESLDFCNSHSLMNDPKFDWQLPSSLAHAIRLEHQIHSPDVTLVLWLTASHTRVTRAKLASCLLHWLFMFTPAVLLFRFILKKNKTLIRLNIKNKHVLSPKL